MPIVGDRDHLGCDLRPQSPAGIAPSLYERYPVHAHVRKHLQGRGDGRRLHNDHVLAWFHIAGVSRGKALANGRCSQGLEVEVAHAPRSRLGVPRSGIGLKPRHHHGDQ